MTPEQGRLKPLIELRRTHPRAFAWLGGGLLYRIAIAEHGEHDPAAETHNEWRARVGLPASQGASVVRLLPELPAEQDADFEALLALRVRHGGAWQLLDQALTDLIERYACARYGFIEWPTVVRELYAPALLAHERAKERAEVEGRQMTEADTRRELAAIALQVSRRSVGLK